MPPQHQRRLLTSTGQDREHAGRWVFTAQCYQLWCEPRCDKKSMQSFPVELRSSAILFSADRPNCAKIPFIEMRTYFSYGFIIRDIKFHNTSKQPSACYRFRSDCSYSLVQTVPPPPPHAPSPLFFPLSRTEEQAKTGTCARDRRALQQLALNVHVKHSDLT